MTESLNTAQIRTSNCRVILRNYEASLFFGFAKGHRDIDTQPHKPKDLRYPYDSHLVYRMQPLNRKTGHGVGLLVTSGGSTSTTLILDRSRNCSSSAAILVAFSGSSMAARKSSNAIWFSKHSSQYASQEKPSPSPRNNFGRRFRLETSVEEGSEGNRGR